MLCLCVLAFVDLTYVSGVCVGCLVLCCLLCLVWSCFGFLVCVVCALVLCCGGLCCDWCFRVVVMFGCYVI